MPFSFRFLAPLLLAPCLTACSVITETTDKINGPEGRAQLDFASQPTVYTAAQIYRGDISVMVHPNINLEKSPSALFVPLGLTQAMRDDGLMVSQSVSRQVWQQFLSHSTFSTLEMADIRPPHKVELALPLARRMKASLLVGGYITYYMDAGSSIGDTKISIHLEIYDVKTGDLLWSIAHAGMLPYQNARDFIFLQSKPRRPADPMGAVIAAVAGDMAQLIHMWTDPEATKAPPNRASKPFDSAFGKF